MFGNSNNIYYLLQNDVGRVERLHGGGWAKSCYRLYYLLQNDTVAEDSYAATTLHAVDSDLAADIKTLSSANDTVAAGYYEATTLHAVDANLASSKIKSGVTIFGIAGAATVQDISDADAVEADVVSGKKFYSITGGVKTGTKV